MLFYSILDILNYLLFALFLLHNFCTAMSLVCLEILLFKYKKKISTKFLKNFYDYICGKSYHLSGPMDYYPKCLITEKITKLYLKFDPPYFLHMESQYQTYNMCKFILLQDPTILQFLPEYLLTDKIYKFVIKKKLVEREPELVLCIPMESRTLEMYLNYMKEYPNINDLPKHMQSEAIYSQIFKNTPDVLDASFQYHYYRNDITYEQFVLDENTNFNGNLFNYVFRYSSVTKYMKTIFYKLIPFKYQMHKINHIYFLLFIKN